MTRRILVLEDDDSLRLVISKALSRAGFEVRSTPSPDVAVERMARREADALVADVLLGRENFLDRLDEVSRLRPDAPVVVMSAQTTAENALVAARQGAFEYLPKPFDLDELVALLERALRVPGKSPASASRQGYEGLVGSSKAMQDAFRAIGRLARVDAPVLVTGPEGSGRAAAASVIHRESGREGPLVLAGPDRLRREGPALLDGAAGGSIVLRRAERWSADIQDWLLEALEAPAANAPRFLATAAPDVSDHLQPALLNRLAAGLIEMPALRDRGADKAGLFRYFLQKSGQGAFVLTAEAADFINARTWEGEVLELERTVLRIVSQGVRGEVGPDDVRAAMKTPAMPDGDALLSDAARRYFAAAVSNADDKIAKSALSAVERGLIEAALQACAGVRQDAARLLGMNRNTLARRMAELGLDADIAP